MGILLAFLGSLMLYGKSRYFPKYLVLPSIPSVKKQVWRLIAYLLFALSLYVYYKQLGFGTALVVWSMSLMLSLSMVMVVLPLNKGYVFALTLMTIVVLVVESYW